MSSVAVDFLGRAVTREREHVQQPWMPLEVDSVWMHVFRCVCCGRKRRIEERREPRSEVCVRCVREAGYEN